MANVKIAEILLVRPDYKFFLEQHFAWHVNKKRSDAELSPAQMADHYRADCFFARLLNQVPGIKLPKRWAN